MLKWSININYRKNNKLTSEESLNEDDPIDEHFTEDNLI